MPATPQAVAAPELLLKMTDEVTLAIDVWALACTIYQLLGAGGPFAGLCGPLGNYLAEIMVTVGGGSAVPSRFWKAFTRSGATDAAAARPGRLPSWDDKIAWMRRDPDDGEGDDGEPVPPSLGEVDESVVRKLVAMAFVIDPADRKPASAILTMLQESWRTADTPLE